MKSSGGDDIDINAKKRKMPTETELELWLIERVMRLEKK